MVALPISLQMLLMFTEDENIEKTAVHFSLELKSNTCNILER
jgi:hypothetical protein